MAPNGPAKTAPAEPVWVGEPALLDKVVQALRSVREAQGGPDIVSSGRVRSLEITPDEAVLTMHLGGGHCGSAQVLAELAFDVLREQLPDTDLYLRHEQSGGCPTT
ncbi:iron-sulfur cluster assembly protein [Sphaerotilus montanus]|uniref:iron-sulfur cluster assembly protein n=1 Tax=Sphaerotilus montanus TaxID=522889 RepID=UPI0015CC0662|nr:iron-sulfur cluster assembly protein [Sphaerotilus montanus]